MNPSATPSSMLPPQQVAALVRAGGSGNEMFQQNPLSQNMTPGAMGADPALMQQPPVGSQAMDPTSPSPQAGMQQPTGGVQPMSEAEMIISALSKRLQSHSKITEGTISTLQKMVEAGLPVDQSQPQEQ